MKHLLIDSEFCSMGRWISVIIADTLNMNFYETKQLLQFSEEKWLTEKYLLDFDERITLLSIEEVKKDKEFIKVHDAITKAILKVIEKGPCIIHERAASTILKGNAEFLKVMLYSTNLENKLPRAKLATYLNLDKASKEEIIKSINKEDQKRRIYHDAISSKKWGDKETYDICLNSDLLSKEKCAEILIEALTKTKLDEEEGKKIIQKIFEKV